MKRKIKTQIFFLIKHTYMQVYYQWLKVINHKKYSSIVLRFTSEECVLYFPFSASSYCTFQRGLRYCLIQALCRSDYISHKPFHPRKLHVMKNMADQYEHGVRYSACRRRLMKAYFSLQTTHFLTGMFLEEQYYLLQQ